MSGDLLSVRNTFDGKVVLLTGGTGFVGSVVLEQLIRLVPTIKKVYVLVREKRGVTGEERLKSFLKASQLFAKHWKEGRLPEDVSDKVVAVAGDTCSPGLGLSASDRQRLVAEVDYVIHSAASISFFEHIQTLLQQNYEATRQLALLARDMKNLRGLVYVSTAYVNANLPSGSRIEERIYPLHGSNLQHSVLAAQLAAMSPKKAEKTAQRVLKQAGLPNNYLLTKHMSEDLLADLHCDSFRVAIVRPTIVGALAGAPLPGYFGNTAGVTSSIIAFASGMVRYSCHDPTHVFDIIPCDLVAANVLVAACALQQSAWSKKVLVTHSASSCTHPVNYLELYEPAIYPFWAKDPPKTRLVNAPYKKIDDPSLFLSEKSLMFKGLTLKYDMRFGLMGSALKLAGKKKLATLIAKSWTVWKLYNCEKMDVNLYFYVDIAKSLEELISPDEQEPLKMIWMPKDRWDTYLICHMHAIRAKFFPDPKAKA